MYQYKTFRRFFNTMIIRGIACDRPFLEWRDNALYKFSPRLTKEHIYNGAAYGLRIDCSEIVNRQLNIIGANVYHRSDMEEAAELLSDSAYNFETVITNEFPPEECKEAFALLNSGDKNAEKVVFTFA